MRTLAIIICMALLSVPAFGQNQSATVSGNVTGNSPLPVAGVALQLKNTETGAVYKATSGPLGNYTISDVPAGKYDLSASSFGFKPFERKDIVVTPGQKLQLNIPIGDFISLDTLGEDRATIGRMLFGRPKPPEGPVPGTPDGKPDLSGIWYGTLPGPGAAQLELQPWAEKVSKERFDNNQKDVPSARCLPFNVGVFGGFTNRIVQSPDILITILEYDIPGYRQVYLDGRGHPKDLEPTWTGHSIGKWDGDTLVIDTIGFNDKTWLPETAPHTDKLHLTTRLRRIDLGHLEIENTFDDPGAFKKPWVVKGTAALAPSKEEIPDFICTENNQDVEHLVGK